jgi:hypothetical protein
MRSSTFVLLLASASHAAAPGDRPANRPPEALLPAGCIAFIRYDGMAAHKKAYERTALAQVMREDLGEALEHIWNTIDTGLVVSTPDWQRSREVFRGLLQGMEAHGAIAGLEINDRDLREWRLTVVIPEGTKPPYRDAVRLAFKILEQKETEPFEFKERKVSGRAVREAKHKLGTISAWDEAAHTIVTVGTMPVEQVLAAADGKAANLTTTRNYRLTADFKGYESDIRAFVDLEKIVDLLRAPAKGNQGWGAASEAVARHVMFSRIGLTGLKTMTVHLGFDGKYQRSTVKVHVVPAEKRFGILKLPGSGLKWDEKDLFPPLPPDVDSVGVRHIEWDRVVGEIVNAYDFYEFLNLFGSSRKVVEEKKADDAKKDEKDEPLDEQEPAEPAPAQLNGREKLRKAMDDFRREVVPALDSRYVCYSAPSEGLFSTGAVWSIRLKDEAKLERALEQLKKNLQELINEAGLRFEKSQYRGADLTVVTIPHAPIAPTYVIRNGWLTIGLLPQPVKGFLWRSEPGRRAWLPPKDLAALYAKARANGPADAKLGSVHVTDVRPTVNFGLATLPLMAAAMQESIPFRIDLTKLPHAQVVTEPLFPNVDFFFDDGDALRWESHFSIFVPDQLFFVGAAQGPAMFWLWGF